MASLYRKITGLGALYSLPPEVRQRIYTFYFSERTLFEGSNNNYCASYHRKLLLASKSIYDEAAAKEKAPGASLLVKCDGGEVPPTNVRQAVTTIDLSELEQVDLVKWNYFDAATFPMLRYLRYDCQWDLGTDLTLFPSGTINDALHGRIDSELIKHIQTAESIYNMELIPFDWNKLPRNLTLVLEWKMGFNLTKAGKPKRVIVSFNIIDC